MTKPQARPNPVADAQTNLRPMANAIRALTMDAVAKAKSGHTGMPMGMADAATVLYSKFLKFDPKHPEWADRDRFVLSAGHGSMLLYALNYLTGYDAITLDQIKNFRQLGAITAGHPEVEHHAGIETTTGPLGQGISTAVGMALAERLLNARFGDDLVNHYTYVIASDGDLQEGVSHEACSLAGHLGLGRLIVLYDDNEISIDGPTSLSFSENIPQRFESYGWDVFSVDGHELDEIESAIAKAKASNKPTIICCKTRIGFGLPTQEGTSTAHGAITDAKEIEGTRKNLDWPHEPFVIPDHILKSWRGVGEQGRESHNEWEARLVKSKQKDEFLAAQAGDVSKTIAPLIAEVKTKFASEKPKLATRQASGVVLEALVPKVPAMIGGSADLTGSVNTKIKSSTVVEADKYKGQYVYYGVREHGMAAVMNGMALHGGIIPYAGTFLVFTDYCRPAIRLSALMKQRVVYVMTHDSIGLGEDGPTHQPIEHVASFRAMPNINVFRPCDGIETAEAWELALGNQKGPSILALTRQGLPTINEGRKENLTARGAYVLKENGKDPRVTIFASGSEVEIALKAYEQLTMEGFSTRLVSVPCMELLCAQDDVYIDSLLGNNSLKVAVEAGVRQGWDCILGPDGVFIGMDSFGASAPYEKLYQHFGITAEAVVKAVKEKL
ncbi:MAG: transketolase [Alphaproteobacteria bacterium PRO2]|nr:transketolase [Alphaproteobacteria bacterium PRO2]